MKKLDYYENPDEWPYLPPDTLVLFHVDEFIDPTHVVMAGMYGVVVNYPYAAYGCTPGISTMIQIIGRQDIYGYLDVWFEVVTEDPSEEDLIYSLQLCEQAFEIFEHLYGYTGYIKMGQKIRPQGQLFKELDQQLVKVGQAIYNGNIDINTQGAIKRIRKLLRAFTMHPNGEMAEHLSNQLNLTPETQTETLEQLTFIRNWIQQSSGAERMSSQKERIIEAKREGWSERIHLE